MPGSAGEHLLQQRHGTAVRARAFYDHQVLDRLNERMQDFVRRMDMFFLATSDASGECDSSFRAGPPGFVGVLDERTLAYPEYRGNGVMASLGNVVENGHVGLLFLDFCGDRIGLHVNGRARILAPAELLARESLPDDVREAAGRSGDRAPQHWVLVDVVEAYIHCAKHVPHLARRDDPGQVWGTDDQRAKGGDHFRAKHDPRPWVDAVPSPRDGASGEEHHGVAELVPQVPLGDGRLVGPRDG
jgi:hypothetical protein